MSLFENRERAFEAKYARKEDFGFQASARRNRKMARWAGQRMELCAVELADYELFIIQLGTYYGDQGVRDRLLHDLQKAATPVSEHRLRRMMDEWLAIELEAPISIMRCRGHAALNEIEAQCEPKLGPDVYPSFARRIK